MSHGDLLKSAAEWCRTSLKVPDAAADILSRLQAPMESDGTAVVLVGASLTNSGLTSLMQIFRGRLFIRALEDEQLTGWTMNPAAVRSQTYPPITDIIAQDEGIGSAPFSLEWIQHGPIQRTPLTADLSIRIRWSGGQMTSAHGFHISLFGHNERVFFTKYANWDDLPELNEIEVPLSIPVSHTDLYTVFVEIVVKLPGRLAVEQAVSNPLMEVFVV